MPYIYSTLSCDQNYTSWESTPSGMQPGKQVLVKGGANVADTKHIITELGICTEVTDAELALLETIPAFCQHRDNGFITVETKRGDAAKVASGMEARDQSAPLTPSDFEVKGEKAPKTQK